MALPSSGPISGSQIATELGLFPSTNISLRGLSSTASFSSPDSYSEFYGYSALTLFYATSTTSKFAVNVCSLYANVSLWHDGAGSTPVIGDNVYTNSSGTTDAFWIGYKGWGAGGGANGYAGRITSGVITSAVIC
jgi:hypothetical protein